MPPRDLSGIRQRVWSSVLSSISSCQSSHLNSLLNLLQSRACIVLKAEQALHLQSKSVHFLSSRNWKRPRARMGSKSKESQQGLSMQWTRQVPDSQAKVAQHVHAQVSIQCPNFFTTSSCFNLTAVWSLNIMLLCKQILGTWEV